jgi:hypothetical protein
MDSATNMMVTSVYVAVSYKQLRLDTMNKKNIYVD